MDALGPHPWAALFVLGFLWPIMLAAIVGVLISNLRAARERELLAVLGECADAFCDWEEYRLPASVRRELHLD